MTVQNPCLSGGMIEVFVEPVVPAPRVLVEGDMPISHALLRLGGELGLDMVASSAASSSRATDDLALVVAGHGREELPALKAGARGGRALRRARGEPPARRRACSASCKSDGVAQELLDRIDTPAGLDIGARTPEEIALVDPGQDRRGAARAERGAGDRGRPGVRDDRHRRARARPRSSTRARRSTSAARAARTPSSCSMPTDLHLRARPRRGRLEAARAAEADAAVPRRDAARPRGRRGARVRLRPADRGDRRRGRRGARAVDLSGAEVVVNDAYGEGCSSSIAAALGGGRPALRRARADARRPAGRDGGDGARAAGRARRRGAGGVPLRRRARAPDRVRALDVRRARGPARRQGRVEAGRPGRARTCRSPAAIPLDVDTPEDYAAVR